MRSARDTEERLESRNDLSGRFCAGLQVYGQREKMSAGETNVKQRRKVYGTAVVETGVEEF